MVYLIHFDRPLHHASHYIGYSKNKLTFKNRIDHHRRGTGAKILRELNRLKIGWEVVRVWKDKDGNFERLLKKSKNSKRYCPTCKTKKP